MTKHYVVKNGQLLTEIQQQFPSSRFTMSYGWGESRSGQGCVVDVIVVSFDSEEDGIIARLKWNLSPKST